MAENWDDRWADPPTDVPSTNSSQPVALINIEPMADSSVVLQAFRMRDKRRRENPNGAKSIILLPTRMKCSRALKVQLTGFHALEGVMSITEARDPIAPSPSESTNTIERANPSPAGQIGDSNPS